MATKKKVLIVDDELTNVDLLNEILSEKFHVKSADSGKTAFAAIYDFKPDVILLDIMMPEMDGYQVCKQIRSDKSLRYIKIILVSAKVFLEERLQGYKAGADDYITKPFNADELLAKIRVFLRLKYAEEMDALKTNILTLISQKNSSPLFRILGFVKLLMKEETLSQEGHANVQMTMENCMQLWRYVKKNQLMCELKEKDALSTSRCQMARMITDILPDLKERASSKNVSFKFDARCEEEFSVDSNLMRKALSCVLEAALDVSPGKSVIEISSERNNGHYVIKITDNGGNIDEAQMEQIFDEFGLPEGEGKYSQKRDSLSLAIAQAIVRLHGGKLTAENHATQGMTFIFSLPENISNAQKTASSF